MKNYLYSVKSGLSILLLFVIFWDAPQASSYPVSFQDSQGQEILITKSPSRVISLVPSITEIISEIGAREVLKGVTYHDTYPVELARKEIIGGFLHPSLTAIERVQPDLIFLSKHHTEVKERFKDEDCLLVNLEINSISDTYNTILLLGKIFNREYTATRIVRDIKDQLELIAKKVEKIPNSKRKKVIRLMGRDSIQAPGDDSFQNEMIRAAGGIPPLLGKKGNIVSITKEEWMRFNPQVIYGCGADRKAADKFFHRPGWKDVEAVRNGNIFFFPCELTCRAATHTGHFVSWLSAQIYTEEFSKKENQVLTEDVFTSRHISIPLDYIENARIAYSNIYDFVNKSLIIDFKVPLSVVSTLEGQRNGIRSVGNHYSSPPCWGLTHKAGLDKIRERVYQVIGRSKDKASFLFTGADMDNLAIKRKRFREMEVYALVTAGVETNAVRMSKDEGNFYESGTINIILLPNVRLTPRAMTRAIVSATEAKTAALTDMDIRSSYTPLINQATGTGTDNIIVVEGKGFPIDNAGGHTKMGELIARAVYEAVQEAVSRQNGITARRTVFQRLEERGINLYEILSGITNRNEKRELVGKLEELLLQPRYAAFLESALALSDYYERGLITHPGAYELWCKAIAEEIAGKKIRNMRDNIDGFPRALEMSLNAILTGLFYRLEENQGYLN